MEKVEHIYDCEYGNYTDCVYAESQDHAKIEFAKLTTLLGKPIITNNKDIKVRVLVANAHLKRGTK